MRRRIVVAAVLVAFCGLALAARAQLPWQSGLWTPKAATGGVAVSWGDDGSTVNPAVNQTVWDDNGSFVVP